MSRMTDGLKTHRPRPCATVRLGLTLIEILVVFVIISILLALLFPVVQVARESARRASCGNNLRQLSLAVREFVDAHHRFPDPAPAASIGGWSIAILSFLEEKDLADALANNPSLDPQTRSPLARTRPPIMTCPSVYESDSDISSIPVAHYAAEFFREDVRSGRSVIPKNKTIKDAHWYIGDLPVESRIAWPTSPERPTKGASAGSGPHSGGYMLVSTGRAHQDHVSFQEQW